MADQAITALPKKTYSGSSKIAATDYLLGIDSAEGYQMLIQDLGEYIINRVTASLAGSNQTLAAAISALNSKETLNITTSTGTWPSEITLHSASYAYRFNNVVMIHLNFKIVSDTKKSLIIEGVLPESMRPNSDVYAMGGDGDTDGICQPFMIRSDGKISMWNTKTGTTYLQADATYIAKSGT